MATARPSTTVRLEKQPLFTPYLHRPMFIFQVVACFLVFGLFFGFLGFAIFSPHRDVNSSPLKWALAIEFGIAGLIFGAVVTAGTAVWVILWVNWIEVLLHVDGIEFQRFGISTKRKYTEIKRIFRGMTPTIKVIYSFIRFVSPLRAAIIAASYEGLLNFEFTDGKIISIVRFDWVFTPSAIRTFNSRLQQVRPDLYRSGGMRM